MGKLANISPEIGNRLLSNDTLKRLISREPVDYRKLYKDIQESNDYGRLWFNANRLPVVKEHSEAFFRRFIIMPFNVTIPKEKRDKYLANRLVKDELPGVFNWRSEEHTSELQSLMRHTYAVFWLQNTKT